MPKKIIRFYSVRSADLGFMSNFYRAPFDAEGESWPTSEHYFQAHKFLDPSIQATIRSASTPTQAAKLGRSRRFPLRADWETIKNSIMADALHFKFTQHEDIKGKLLATEDATLVEHTTKDLYWADGGDGSGLNWLGRLLMEEREKLISQITE